jgi:hypothetical protein
LGAPCVLEITEIKAPANVSWHQIGRCSDAPATVLSRLIASEDEILLSNLRMKVVPTFATTHKCPALFCRVL